MFQAAKQTKVFQDVVAQIQDAILDGRLKTLWKRPLAFAWLGLELDESGPVPRIALTVEVGDEAARFQKAAAPGTVAGRRRAPGG